MYFRSVPPSDIKFYIKLFLFHKFQEYWTFIQTNQKLRQIKPNIKPWPSLLSTNRRDVRVLNRLRIVHTYLTHKFLFQTPQVLPMCPHCNNTLTVQHILFDCVHLANLRIRLNFPATLEGLLGENVNLYNLMKFLRDSDYYHEI